MRFEVQRVSILHLGQLQLEVGRRPLAGMMIPPIGEQDTPDVQEQGRDRIGFFHKVGGWEVWQIGLVIA